MYDDEIGNVEGFLFIKEDLYKENMDNKILVESLDQLL